MSDSGWTILFPHSYFQNRSVNCVFITYLGGAGAGRKGNGRAEARRGWTSQVELTKPGVAGHGRWRIILREETPFDHSLQLLPLMSDAASRRQTADSMHRHCCRLPAPRRVQKRTKTQPVPTQVVDSISRECRFCRHRMLQSWLVLSFVG